MSRVGRLIAAGVLGGGGPPLPFMNDGSSFPWSNPDIDPAHLYVSSTDTTWFSWEGYETINGTPQRVVMCCTFNHTTHVWSGNYLVGVFTLTNDIHGVPTIARDSAGFVYVGYGCHGSAIKIASTVAADDPSKWAHRLSTGTNITLHKLLVVGTHLFLFYVTGGVGVGTQEALAVRSATVSSGVPTFGSAVNLFDLAVAAANGWCAVGKFVLNGTDIHMAFARGSSVGAPKKDVYYAIYDTTNGNVKNFDSSTTVAGASQPISTATAQSSFRIYTTVAADGNQPSIGIDGLGNLHVVLADGSNAPMLLHMISSGGGAWSATHTVFTYPNAVSAFNVDCAIVPNAANGIDIYFPDGASVDGALAVGNIQRVTRSSAGAWSGTSTIMRGSFDSPSAIIPAHANARVAFTEVTSDELTISGTLKGYVWGDAGNLRRPAGFTFVNPYGPTTGMLDAANKSANTAISTGGYTATSTANNGSGNVVRSTTSKASGKYWIEARAGSPGANGILIGLVDATQSMTNHFLGETGNKSIGWLNSGNVYRNGAGTNIGTYATGDYIGLDIDLDGHTCAYYKNGVLVSSRDISALPGTLYFACEADDTGSNWIVNFGGTPYIYPPPSGRGAWT